MISAIYTHPEERLAAIDSEGEKLTYGDITAFAESLKVILPERSFYFLLTENNVGGIAWTIGGILSKNVPLLLNAHQDDGLVDNLLEVYEPPFIVVPEPQKGDYPEFNEIHRAYGYTLLKTDNEPVELNPELSHLLPTSGSTGSPKLVRHMYSNIEAAALNISTFFKLTPEDRPLMVLPLYYTMGLSMVFSHFRAGATVLITGRNMTDPVFWKFIRDERATSFTGVPFSFKVLDMMRIYRMKLPDLHLLTQGGGKMPRDLNIKFAQWCMDTGREWIATYGQSEGTARMAWLPSKWALEKVGSIGIAVPNGELWLVDEKGEMITTPNIEGEMCYRGRNVTMGYARSIGDLALGDERHGWMRTGDIAYFDEDGCYYITGRIGRFLKLFGKRIALDECEQIAREASPEGEIACIGTDESMTVFVTKESADKMVKDAIIQKTGLPANVIETRFIENLPKNEAGKILYSKLKEL